MLWKFCLHFDPMVVLIPTTVCLRKKQTCHCIFDDKYNVNYCLTTCNKFRYTCYLVSRPLNSISLCPPHLFIVTVLSWELDGVYLFY